MNPTIYFDMDGTIADLYSYPDWLAHLINEETTPYDEASPIFAPSQLVEALTELKQKYGVKIGVISWTSKRSTNTYHMAVRKAKVEWLKKMGYGAVLDEIHITRYGVPKSSMKRSKTAILVDDDALVRQEWERAGGTAINPQDGSLFDLLMGIKTAWHLV